MNRDHVGMEEGLGGMEELGALQSRLDSLVTLAGREKVAGMLARFAETLDHLLKTPPDETWPSGEVHRMVGVSGILGFTALERRWRALEDAPYSAVARNDVRRSAAVVADYARNWG